MSTRDDHHPSVSQASGMVSVQAECTVEEALALMKERAQVSGSTLLEIAEATVDRRIRFGPIT
jgi:AmiR/NasT family two-component response regulator